MHLRRLAVTVALWTTSCGIGADAPLMMTCDIRTNTSAAAHGECQEWRGDKTDKTNAMVNFDSICTSTLGGSVVMGACPTGAVGVCTKRPSVAERVVLHFYFAPDFDAASASANCSAQGGAFSAK